MHIYRTVAAKPAPKVIANASAEPGPVAPVAEPMETTENIHVGKMVSESEQK